MATNVGEAGHLIGAGGRWNGNLIAPMQVKPQPYQQKTPSKSLQGPAALEVSCLLKRAQQRIDADGATAQLLTVLIMAEKNVSWHGLREVLHRSLELKTKTLDS